MVIRWRTRGSQKYMILLLSLGVASLLVYYIAVTTDLSGNDSVIRITQGQRKANPLLAEQVAFWRALYSQVLLHDPKCTPPEKIGMPHKLDIGFDPTHIPPRPDLLWLKPADLLLLKEAHQGFVEGIQSKPLSLPYHAGTRGIAVTAGLKQLPVLLTSLLMLRRSGSKLPVEVFLSSKDDYKPEICDDIFPSMNVKCLVLEEIFHASESGISLTSYQYKIIALLFSSFESVLLLDSDAFPVVDPEYVFHSTVFKTYGMVLYPDFWFVSESPYFFEIASISTIPPLSARPATESGEIFLDKRQHNLTLLLAAYYNCYGPDHYYVLQSQGAPGQGDKETFGWAATATNSSFYFVHTPVKPIGHFDSTGEFTASSMAQHDPVTDYNLHHLPSEGIVHLSDSDITDSRTSNDIDKTDANYPPGEYPAAQPKGPDNNTTKQQVPGLFLHVNYPKFDPSTLFLSSTQPPGKPNPTFDSNGTAVRPWGDSLSSNSSLSWVGDVEIDIERVFWEQVEIVSCRYGREMGVFGDWSLKGVLGSAEVKEAEGKMDVCDVVRAWMGKVFDGKASTAEGKEDSVRG